MSMTALDSGAAERPPVPFIVRSGRKRAVGDRVFSLLIRAAVWAVVLVGAALVLVMIVAALPSVKAFGWRFPVTSTWDPVASSFGALPFVYGTVVSSLLALLIALPLSLGAAIYLAEFAPPTIRSAIAFLIELLAAIPSVVYGLWGIFVMVPAVRSLEVSAPDWLRQTPFFSGPPLGVGMLAAGLILAIMVIPFTSSVAREVLKSVPLAQREGAYALGATRFEAIRAALFFARTGIIGAIMLGFGRALGETMAVTMVIGNNPQLSASLFAPQYTMAAVIANEFTEAADDLYLSALVEIGLVLFIITLVVNSLSRLLIWSMARPAKARVFASTVPAQESAV